MIAPLRLCARRSAVASAAPVSMRALSGSAVRLSSAGSCNYKNIIVSDVADGKVRLITLNRPKALNALNSELFHELNDATDKADNDPAVGAIVLTGSDKAFAAGADIKEMKDKQYGEAYKNNFLGHWTKISSIRKPIIAAVSGYALGGGCELAMMCDIILAAPNANFGQPEINLGVIPGAGGSQRLTKAIGKSLAMEIILTGRNVTAEEAVAHGLASRIVKEGSVVDEAVKVGATIAKKGQIAVQAGKEAVNASYELSLNEGLRFERRLFQGLFATKDQKEGMSAFAEKRKALFTNE
ncbi:putative enoyl-CoA hydratase precursor, mitochondrial [Tilletiaria anomala UBC 951]|uniref:Probable enoyl-CoA hydratase, mitochondrial n=1 Tax=Tilletiaria anomala (strain ATCC 24038 / CBS 436.72 / UBC 951) TaxID=1037660 RepID=A0A066WPI2_TILAU|nr:putative enoyl-CoA hydratase precursor, mitochondrial [Tilletiaria anomala UBC 951]KDN52535.1 putative enoyl-CoA hydratase precursor, mitochondrial [Tilletiaria anomala UBC 951]